MTTIPQTSPKGHTLLEHLVGPKGEACHWADPPVPDGTDMTEGSLTCWLVFLPDHNEAGTDNPDDFNGIYVVHWINCDHPSNAYFKNEAHPFIRERFAGQFSLQCSEAYGDGLQVSAPQWFEFGAEPSLMDNGEHRAAADPLMRIWVEELLHGRLDPVEGVVAAATHEDAVAYFNGLMARAETAAKGG